MTRQPRSPAPIDPVTLEVVRHAVFSVAEEMRAVLMRSARSPVLKEAGDLSCALTDADGNLVAQGRDIPIHLGVMAFTVAEFLRRVPISSLREGDVYFTNDPEVGGNHLPDVKAITPVFHGGRPVAFAVNLAHWPDVGGARRGSYVATARDRYAEGLCIPPVPLFLAGAPNDAMLEVVLSNVRGREERRGDILAQCAANAVATRRLREIFERFGGDTVAGCLARMLDESDGLMRRAIASLPAGEYAGEDWLDGDGIDERPVRIAVRVRPEGDHLDVDFDGTAPETAGPLNATRFVTASAVFYAVRALLGPEIPANGGCYRPIRLRVPAATVLNPGPEAPRVGGNHETSQRVVDAVFRALAPALPDRIVAGGAGTSGLVMFGGRDEDGRPFVLYEVHGGGEGAGRARDGTNAVRVHMSNVMNTPVEVIESEYPLRVECCALRPDSGGPGRHRGGLGLRRSYRVLCEGVELSTMIERARVRPWGVFGGGDGVPFRVTCERGGERLGVGPKENRDVRRGDLIVLESSGGGGYGPPEDRPAALRRLDLENGYVSGADTIGAGGAAGREGDDA
ncbi:MAG TPA: hydantoinase B/oxoprolinase family protein [bacterium]|nr:hydantoinase B/oxoprolinase family protein [bacterium]